MPGIKEWVKGSTKTGEPLPLGKVNKYRQRLGLPPLQTKLQAVLFIETDGDPDRPKMLKDFASMRDYFATVQGFKTLTLTLEPDESQDGQSWVWKGRSYAAHQPEIQKLDLQNVAGFRITCKGDSAELVIESKAGDARTYRPTTFRNKNSLLWFWENVDAEAQGIPGAAKVMVME